MRVGFLVVLAVATACGGDGNRPPGGDGGEDAGRSDADGADGGCRGDFDCDEGIACTIDVCMEGVCNHEPCIGCCPEGRECVADQGCVVRQPCEGSEECDDEVRCTLDRCTDGFCEHRPNSDLCDGTDVCLAELGCIPEIPESCESAEDCTRGNECLGEWSCQPEFGCQFLTGPDCDDDDACTVDSCDLEAGMCVNAAGTEECNGEDDDCDDIVDEGCCTAGEACTTSCGSMGTTTCDPMGCMPPAEGCTGRDDDCDGVIDETSECTPGEMQACSTTCGSMSTQTCLDSCTWGACAPPAEVCSGDDTDCDGMTDEGFDCARGSMGDCPTTCGSTGSRMCLSSCGWDLCVPPTETCNGVDDDCDGTCDDGFTCCRGTTRDCTALGMGFTDGTAVCRTNCNAWNTSGCSTCGNMSQEGTEECDGSDLGGGTCRNIGRGFGGGTLACTGSCAYDTGGCTRCGNSMLDVGEDCDGTLLGGADCTTVPGGFTGGTLGCNSACSYDTSMCDRFDPSGTYSMTPAPAYMCALFLGTYFVDFSIGSLTISDDGTTLTVITGQLPCNPTGSSARSSRMINATCTATGGCNETYSLIGTYSDDDTFTGSFSATYRSGTGSCLDCTDQSWSVTGMR